MFNKLSKNFQNLDTWKKHCCNNPIKDLNNMVILRIIMVRPKQKTGVFTVMYLEKEWVGRSGFFFFFFSSPEPLGSLVSL